jgi:hypothetical protein
MPQNFEVGDCNRPRNKGLRIAAGIKLIKFHNRNRGDLLLHILSIRKVRDGRRNHGKDRSLSLCPERHETSELCLVHRQFQQVKKCGTQYKLRPDWKPYT